MASIVPTLSKSHGNNMRRMLQDTRTDPELDTPGDHKDNLYGSGGHSTGPYDVPACLLDRGLFCSLRV